MTVAVTGATGTVGSALMPLLEADPEVDAVVAIGTRPFRTEEHGWPKTRYERGDVRDAAFLRRALAGADVVVNLAFSLYGIRSERELRERNVAGSMTAFRVAAETGARRFVHASSATVYGFWPDRAGPVREDAPLRPPARHFYSTQKAEIEVRLRDAHAKRRDIELTIFRPCTIVGPHAAGSARRLVPGPLRSGAPAALALLRRLGLTPLAPGPPVPLQFVHEADVALALRLAAGAEDGSATYNLGGDGMVEGPEVIRALGLRPLPAPRFAVRAAASSVRLAAMAPLVPPALGWAEALLHPLEVDTSAAREALWWTPTHDSRGALADTAWSLGLAEPRD